MRRARGRQKRDEVGTVAPGCALVQEAISAALDDEHAPLDIGDVERHLARCRACRRFEALAGALSGIGPGPPVPFPPTTDALTAVPSVTRGCGAVAARVAGRLRAALPAHAVPWAVLAVGIGIALPSASLSTLAHFEGTYAHVHAPCATLLHHALKR